MSKYKKYDLHCHSTRSDGTFTPTTVVKKAYESGVDVLALTDHDTTAGIIEARDQAEKLGIPLINGVEISCEHFLSGGYGKTNSTNQIIHVIGLDFGRTEEQMLTMSSCLHDLQISRANRGRATVAKLAEILPKDTRLAPALIRNLKGKDTSSAGNLEERLWQAVLLKAEGNPQAVGRSHIAKVLLEMGVVNNMQQAFNRYIADNKPAYVKIDALTMEEGIKLIHESGGLAALAHPTRYHLSSTRVRKLIAQFAQLGGDASELPPINEPLSKRRMVDKVIEENNLMVSIGSDFHGSTMPWRKLGDVPKLNSNQRGIWENFATST